MLLMKYEVAPLLVNVALSAPLVVPTVTFPNLRPAGLTAAPGSNVTGLRLGWNH